MKLFRLRRLTGRNPFGIFLPHQTPHTMNFPTSVLRPVLLCLMLSVSSVHAQLPGFSLGLGAGSTSPVGHLANVVDTGFNVQGIASLNLPLLPLGVRGTVEIHQMSGIGGGNFRLLSATANGVLRLPAPLISPYLIGGIGIYNSRYDDLDGRNGDAVSNAGLSGGGGLQLGIPGLRIFLEARLHNVFRNDRSTRFVPITAGVVF